MIDAIVKEIDLRHQFLRGKKIESIYFGGGTPSLLKEDEMGRIIKALENHFSWDSNAEITLEANPDDISKKKLKEWKNSGINRLSIGIQSFNDEELKWMNRAHTAEESIASVKMAQDFGFDNISIDLIYGSKFQNETNWPQTLNKAISLCVHHISSYNLTIEKKTLLGTNFVRNKEPAIDEELSTKQFLTMSEVLEAHNFIHYEISNFGKKDFFAKHNSNYWLQQHYLGIGPSAHSFDGHSRQWNLRSNNKYIKEVLGSGMFFEKEMLQTKDRYNEYVLTRLRTIWGCNILEIESLFGKFFSEHFKGNIEPKKEFIQIKNSVFTLNKKGRLQADGIASDLFFL